MADRVRDIIGTSSQGHVLAADVDVLSCLGKDQQGLQ